MKARSTSCAALSPTRKKELNAALREMRQASDAFYRAAVRIGVHPFIEFAGLQAEYIQICRAALEAGIDFAHANTHTMKALPMQPQHASYLAEKLDCIFGPTAQTDPVVRETFLKFLGPSVDVAEPRSAPKLKKKRRPIRLLK